MRTIDNPASPSNEFGDDAGATWSTDWVVAALIEVSASGGRVVIMTRPIRQTITIAKTPTQMRFMGILLFTENSQSFFRCDELGDTNTEVFIDYHHFTFGNDLGVDHDIDRLTGQLV